MTFEIGKIVQLRSGGPLMTVVSAPGSDNKIDCQWFNEDRSQYELASGRFEPAALKKVVLPEDR